LRYKKLYQYLLEKEECRIAEHFVSIKQFFILGCIYFGQEAWRTHATKQFGGCMILRLEFFAVRAKIKG
jgi:hypothetical protein